MPVLAPIMFLIYINYMPEGVGSYIILFADDAKLLNKISTHKDCEELQHDLNKIYEWSKRWEIQFNVHKCHVMEVGKSAMRPKWTYRLGNNIISSGTEEKALEVVIQGNLSPEKYISRIFGDTYCSVPNGEMDQFCLTKRGDPLTVKWRSKLHHIL